MSDLKVTVTGLADLERALSALPDEMQAAPMRAGLKGAGAALAASMSRRAPRDPVPDAPTLAEEIVYQVKLSTARDTAVVLVGPSKAAYYGGFVELGTSKMAARPFMRPALDEDRDDAIGALAAELKPGLERAARKLAKR